MTSTRIVAARKTRFRLVVALLVAGAVFLSARAAPRLRCPGAGYGRGP